MQRYLYKITQPNITYTNRVKLLGIYSDR